jgi:hypothetical protein
MRRDVIERGQNPEDFPILKSRPELWPDLVWVWEAYMFLSSSRQMGFAGPQPISLAEVLAYSDFRGIEDADERDELLHHVQRLDQIYLADHAAKAKSKSAAPHTPKK